MQNHLVLLFLFFGLTSIFAQEKPKIILKDTLTSEAIDPLRPAKASFFSAIVPGLGQVYNKKYWKVPLVYGAIGTSTYLYIDNQKNYHLYRDEYKSRLAGNANENSSLAGLDDDRLIRIQKGFQRNRDLSALFMVGFYVLNIIDANIDAALSQFNVDDKLAFKPTVIKNDITLSNNFGFALNYSF
jgi:hypothetical protein